MSKKKVLSNIPVFLVKSTVTKPGIIKKDLVRSVLLQTDALEVGLDSKPISNFTNG